MALSWRTSVKIVYLGFVLLAFFSACTRTPENSDTVRIEKDIQALEVQAQALDEKIKTSSGDRDKQLILTNERELLRSRLERLKAMKGTE